MLRMDTDLPSSPALAIIPAASRRQAMDWSLVLISQSIEARIEKSPEQGWLLIVDSIDLQKAEEAIRLYQIENKGWRWRHKLGVAGVVFDWTSLVWAFVVLSFHLLGLHTDLHGLGMMRR